MTDIIMHGCNGRMGQMITNIVKEDDDAYIVAGIDIADSIKTNPYPVYTDIDLCDKDADVVITRYQCFVKGSQGSFKDARSRRF